GRKRAGTRWQRFQELQRRSEPRLRLLRQDDDDLDPGPFGQLRGDDLQAMPRQDRGFQTQSGLHDDYLRGLLYPEWLIGLPAVRILSASAFQRVRTRTTPRKQPAAKTTPMPRPKWKNRAPRPTTAETAPKMPIISRQTGRAAPARRA